MNEVIALMYITAGFILLGLAIETIKDQPYGYTGVNKKIRGRRCPRKKL